jgi:integrase
VLQKARKQILTPAQIASPLMRRPYDFRHAGVSWRLNAGTPAPLVAEWAGHTVEGLAADLRSLHRRGRAVVRAHG